MTGRKKHIIKDLSLSEISGVTIPAQSPALVAIMKSDGAAELVKYLSTDEGAQTFSAFLADEARMKQRDKVYQEIWPKIDALRNSIVSIRLDDSLSEDEKRAKIADSVAEFETSCQHPTLDVTTDLMKQFREQEQMDDLAKKAEGLEARVAELTKALAEAEVLAKMSDEEKAFAASLDADEKEKFKAASADERKKLMAKAASADEVFKSVTGAEIRKSVVGEDVFNVLKSQHEAMTEALAKMAEANEKAQVAELTKRAEDEFAHLPGETVAKVAVLKGMASMDDATRDALTAMLKAGNEALSGAFKEIGKSGGKPADLSKASKRDELIKQYKAANPGKSDAQAFVAVIEQNPELYEG